MVALIGVVASLALAPRGIAVAFTARIYYPVGDKRISHSQVYISDILGHHRVQVTRGNRDKGFVRWRGRSRLTWVEYFKGGDRLMTATLPRLVSRELWRVRSNHDGIDASPDIRRDDDAYESSTRHLRVTETGA